MDDLHLYHSLIRIIISGIPPIRYVELMSLRIRFHLILLTKLIDDDGSLLLILDLDPFDFPRHI